MNAREKFIASMAFEPGAPVLKWEYGYWGGTIERWSKEGLLLTRPLPEGFSYGESVRAEGMGVKTGGINDLDIHQQFHFDEGFQRVPINNFMHPPFKEEIIEDHGDWELRQNSFGIIVRANKDHSSLEGFVSSPVKTREDWEKIKAERLQPDFIHRVPKNWTEIAASYKDRSFPLILGGGQGFYGTPRYLLGDEKLFPIFYDDPELILDINDHLCNLWITIYDEVLKTTTVDLALIWEDMCYRGGPLISPKMFRKFMLPFYKRLIGLFHDHNIKTVFVDTDGNCWKLIPDFIEGGVTGLFPFEVASGMIVSEVRKAFPKLQMMGGINKMVLPLGSQAIEEELQKHIVPILDQGGYIPTIDHLVPPDISWSEFTFYRNRLNELIDQYESKI